MHRQNNPQTRQNQQIPYRKQSTLTKGNNREGMKGYSVFDDRCESASERSMDNLDQTTDERTTCGYGGRKRILTGG